MSHLNNVYKHNEKLANKKLSFKSPQAFVRLLLCC
jgi:hypothetical protein